MRLAVPFLLLRLLWRSRRHSGYRSQLWHRLGLYGRHRASRSNERVWIHAVSVGETLAMAPLLQRLLAGRPDLTVLVTSTTPTGAEQVQQKFAGRVEWCWAPFDTPGAVRRFLEHWHPTVGALVETEIWPNLLTHAAARGVPMVLLNARLSERSASGYARVAGLTRQTLGHLAGVAAQTESDASRLSELGAADEAVTVTGSLKFALDRSALRQANEQERLQFGPGAFDRPVWLAASTHPGEEAPVLEAFAQLKAEQPNALLMLAPRHPDRVPGILAMPAMRRYQVARHSAFQVNSDATPESGIKGSSLTLEDDVLVIDTLGRLGALTGCANAVFVGGSLVPHGGHNPLEAAAWCLPILSGPHNFNFASIYRDLLDAHAAVEVDADTLSTALLDCLGQQADTEQVTAMGERAGAYQSAQEGVVERQWAVLAAHLP
ncbi:MAG: 3-deoxy-D-manno-octulosonic acid transferase [Luminiphilus sp.]